MKDSKQNRLPDLPADLEWLNEIAKETQNMSQSEALELVMKLENGALYIRQHLTGCAEESKAHGSGGALTYKPGTQQTTETPNIANGFVMVNLSSWEQKELRALAREAGMPLRHALRNALLHIRLDLQERVKLQRLTGRRNFPSSLCDGAKFN